MNYDEFRAVFVETLKRSGLPPLGFVPGQETLDLRTTDRTCTTHVEPIDRDVGGPFHVSGTISWRWSALHAARTATTEEDLLAQLLGRDDEELQTERPWLRVDIKLRAGLVVGRSLAMPKPAAWARWSREALTRLESVEPLVTADVPREVSKGHHAILAWQGDPEIHLTCTPVGELRLESITVHAFQGIDLPRRWDHPDREPDDEPHEQLAAMFRRVKAALHAWGEVMDHLVATGGSTAS